MALSPAIYMQLVSTSSLFVIRASELAAERSRSSQTRSAAEAIVRDHLRALLRDGVLEGLITITPAQVVLPQPVPNLAPIAAVLSLDLDIPWWKAWLSERPTLESRRSELIRLIDMEGTAMARALADAHPSIAKGFLEATDAELTEALDAQPSDETMYL